MDYLNAASQIVSLLVDRKALDVAQPGHRREIIERALSDALDIVEKAMKGRGADHT
jgi:hypothetical protein